MCSKVAQVQLGTIFEMMWNETSAYCTCWPFSVVELT